MPAGTIVIYGAGGHGKVVADAADAAGFEVVGFIDDHIPPDGRFGRFAVQPPETLDAAVAVHVAIGDNAARAAATERVKSAGCALPPIVHPTAVVSAAANIAEGVFIAPLAVVNAAAHLATSVIINTAAIVEHDCTVDSFAHVAPGAILCGGVQVGEAALVGARAVVLPGVRIGANCIVGAGAVVASDVANGQTVIGNPAQPRGRDATSI